MNKLLLPSPESGNVSGERFIPDGFEEIVAVAAFDYAAKLNAESRSRGGQTILKLNPEDQKTAVGVILDAIQFTQLAENQTILPAKPRELRRIIKTGLELREAERLAAKRLVDELKQIEAAGGGKSVSFNLGLDEKFVKAAKQEAANYPIIPRPENARKLMAMVPARRKAVGQMAVTAATIYMAEHQGNLSETMPTDKFLALNIGLVSELLDTEGKQAPVDRGEMVGAATSLIKKGAKPNPTFLELKDLKLMAAVFTNPEIVSRIPELAVKTAEELLAHSPELIPTGAAAMEAFSEQILGVVRLSQKVEASHSKDSIISLTARGEIFGILPTRPMLGSEALITSVELLPTAKPGTHHLWENAIKVPAGPNKSVLIPAPEKLIAAKAFLGSGRTFDDRINGDRERLSQAIKAWRAYKTAKMVLPERIKKLDGRIKELGKLSKWKSPLSAEVQNPYPVQLDRAILAQSGRISVLTRRINQANAVLKNYRELSTVAGSAAPNQLAFRFLIYRQRQAERRLETFEREENPFLGPEPRFLLTDFVASEGTQAEELIRIRGYLTELEADKTKPLPQKFMSDRQALYNYLRLEEKKLLPDKKNKHKFDKIATGINILLNAKGDNIGRSFWRLWFIDEAKRRERALVTRLERIEKYQADKAEIKIIHEALTGYNFSLIADTASQLTGSQRSVTLDRWIKMQVVAPDFLKRLKGAEKDYQSPEAKQIRQAQQLIELYRRSRVQMRIPNPDQIDKALNDKFRAAQNYKSSKGAAIEVVKLLQSAWKNKNPLVPLDVSAGANLGELIEAASLRIAVVRAAREADESVAARELAKQEIAKLKELKAKQERTVSLNQLKSQRDAKMRELSTADSRLAKAMEFLHLAADPEMIPKSK